MKNIFLLLVLPFMLMSCGGDDDSAIAPIEQISGGTVFGTDEKPLNVGGPNQQNQVYVHLSQEGTTTVARDSWDLGFYTGTDFKVVLNGSVGMAVKALATTDITLPQTQDATVAVGTFNSATMAYVDRPDGDLSHTAFGTIAANEATAKVYLVNLGKKVPTEQPAAGSVNVAGEPRGWKKVKIFADGNGYKVQYADLESATYTEATVAKDASYNFTFFNLTAGTTVVAEPEKDKWDIAFTTFTNEVFDGGASFGAYFFSDYVVTNTRTGVTAIKIEGNEAAFDAFSLAAVNAGDFAFSTDQRVIGENWRDVFTQTVYNDVFFVVKDANGSYYKLRFIAMLNTGGHRGYPTFQYVLLQ